MFSKSFIIQAFFALIILASTLTSTVNATAIAPDSKQSGPLRKLFFFGLVVCMRSGLLTSDVEFVREVDDSVPLTHSEPLFNLFSKRNSLGETLLANMMNRAVGVGVNCKFNKVQTNNGQINLDVGCKITDDGPTGN